MSDDPAMGRGQAMVLDLTRPEDMRMLREGIKQQYDIPEKYLAEAPAILWRVATESEDERARVAAVRTLNDLMRSNWDRTKAIIEAFKIEAAAKAATGLTINGPVQVNIAERRDKLREQLKPGEAKAILESLKAEEPGHNGNGNGHSHA